MTIILYCAAVNMIFARVAREWWQKGVNFDYCLWNKSTDMGYNNYHLDMIINNVSLPQINSWFSEFYVIAQEQFILMRVAIKWRPDYNIYKRNQLGDYINLVIKPLTMSLVAVEVL